MKLPRNEMRAKFGKTFLKPSLTKQSERSSCDINKIVQKYVKTGVMPHVRSAVAQYVDAAMLPDYQSALNTVLDSQETFLALPAKVRAHFQNDPALFVSAFDSDLDESTYNILLEYGLVNKTIDKQEESTPAEAGVATPNS